MKNAQYARQSYTKLTGRFNNSYAVKGPPLFQTHWSYVVLDPWSTLIFGLFWASSQRDIATKLTSQKDIVVISICTVWLVMIACSTYFKKYRHFDSITRGWYNHVLAATSTSGFVKKRTIAHIWLIMYLPWVPEAFNARFPVSVKS